MIDREKWIASQAVMKEVIAKCPNFELEGADGLEEAWIKRRFEYAMKIMEAYSDTPQNAPGQHLSDEKVAQSLPPPSSYSTPQMDNLKMIVGSVEATSNKEYKPGKYRYGIKLLGEWHTSFWKSHYDAASSAKQSGHQIKLLYEEKPYKGKMSRTVQSVELA